MYSFYGGQKGQDFKISRIFANRANDMLNDLKMRWTSPVGVGDYVFINYGDPSYANEATSTYQKNLDIDLKASGKSFTNSIWQKIYVDRNLTVSPDFPESENNIYIFLNLDEDTGDEYGESLKEVSDIETEECFGFGYRLIACITGITPRLQVFHQTIDIEDGDPYITLDITNPDTPKLKFYLQRGQRIEDVYYNVVGSQESPEVNLYTDGRVYIDKDGQTQTATLTRPQMVFDLPKAPSFYLGMMFGQGPLPYFHNMGKLTAPTAYATTEVYQVYKKEMNLISKISYELFNILEADEITYDYNSSTGNITLIDGEHFFYTAPKAESGSQLPDGIYSRSGIHTEENGKVYFNPYTGSEKILGLIKNFYNTLVEEYGLVSMPYQQYDEEGNLITVNRYMWTNEDYIGGRRTDLISSLIMQVFPNTIFPVSTLINDLLEYVFDCIDDKGEVKPGYSKEPYVIDNYNTADYLLGILNRSSMLNEHYADIASGFAGDYYINEPTGKLYILSAISDIVVEGKYLGAITAPAPYAVSKSSSPFTKQDDGTWVRNLPSVKSNLVENPNTLVYQEEFIFDLVNQPSTRIKLESVANDEECKIEQPVGISEDVQQINVKMPMQIHFYTSNSDTKINGDKITYKNKGTKSITISRGDILMYITDDIGDIYRGNVYRFNGDEKRVVAPDTELTSSNWDLIGDLTGATGIPTPKMSISITIDDTMADGVITYTGQDEISHVYNYKAKVAPGGDGTATNDAIIQRILASGEDITNSTEETLPIYKNEMTKNDFISITFYDEGSISSSYWAFYLNGIWQLVSFSGNISSILSSTRNTDELTNKTQAYTINYMENNYLNDHLGEFTIWHEYD